MCGIFSYFCRSNINVDKKSVIEAALKIQHRGPDETHIIHSKFPVNSYQPDGFDKFHLIFHRLMVNGLSPESSQPLVYPLGKPRYYLLCNGEIYNYKELIARYNLESKYHSSSDCEILLHLFDLVTNGKLTMESMLLELRGVFAFVIVDTVSKQVTLARDPIGVRSLYYSFDDKGFGLCSELKGLYDLAEPSSINQFPAGCYGTVDCKNDTPSLDVQSYYSIMTPRSFTTESMDTVAENILSLLETAVKRRIMCDRTTENGVPAVGAYLSGGFDSSAIATLLSKIYPGQLETFSIGFKNAPDLIKARMVAEHIGSKHHEVVVTEEEMLHYLPSVTAQIESPDVTTNRASSFMMKLSEYIRDNTDVIVVYSGEGSDELFGSYLYFHNAPSMEEFHHETLRLVNDLQYFDVLRGDKASAVAGLEIRTPFLDIDFVDYVSTIPPEFKLHENVEKFVLRKALSEFLPAEICWRTKEAMSDGVSLQNRSWSTIIQDHITKQQHSHRKFVNNPYGHDLSISKSELEKGWFKRMFSTAYPGCEHTVPYDCLPKWCGNVSDSSARVLDIYKQKNESNKTVNEVL